MKTSEVLFFIGFAAVAIFILTGLTRDRLRKKRVKGSLAARPQQDDETFGRMFSREPKRADIAIRVRRVLSNNLQMPLQGLTPDDRLNEDLNAELSINPHIFWELEAEFGIMSGIEDPEIWTKTLGRLVTFRDLVEYVEERIAARPAQPPVDAKEKPSRAYDVAIRSIPFLCLGGFLVAVVGILFQKTLLMNSGVMIFLAGFAVWGFANGGEMLRSLIQAIRQSSGKEIVARPFPWILLLSLSIFFLWVGSMLIWGILKLILSSR